MPIKFRAEGSTGTVAIYESSDDLPFTAPLTYKSRVYFHSGLKYPARVATLTGTLSLPSRAGSTPPLTFGADYTLAAHGRAGIPMIEGRWLGIGIGGVSVPMVGSIPVQQSSPLTSTTRWITIGANATNIVAHESWGTSFNGTLAALTLSYEVHVLDVLLS